MKNVIVVGGSTDHGGVVSEGHGTFKIDGKAAHLEGMTHFCPKCKTTVTAISSGLGPTITGKKGIIVNDKASCGAAFVNANQSLTKVNK